MPRPRRTPWVAVDVDGRKDPKIVDLPNDTARYGYFLGVLPEARLASPRGVFSSRALLEEAIGRFAGHVDDYLVHGLLERSPQLCTDCRKRYGKLREGALVVHNWHAKQSDPTRAERDLRYRNGQHADGESDGESDAESDGITDAPSAGARVETPDTRHLDTRHVDTREAPPARARAKPPTPARATGREAGSSVLSIAEDDPRRPVAELLARRFKWTAITAEQWAMLAEVVDNEYPAGTRKGRDPKTGWRWMARELGKLGRDAGSPLDAFLGTYNAALERRRAEADADEAAWAETKRVHADEAADAATAIAEHGLPVTPGSKANGHAPKERPRDEVLSMLRSYRGTVDDAAWSKLLGRYHVTEEELADAS